MIQLENTTLYTEVNAILTNEDSDKHTVTHEVTIHTELLDYEDSIVESVESTEDYNSNVADYILATLHIQAGDFVKDIYPYRNNLQVTLTRIVNGERITRDYIGVIVNGLSGFDSSRYSKATKEELNTQDQIRIGIQCIDPYMYRIRNIDVSGIYSDITVGELLSSKFGNIRNALGNINNFIVDISEPDNLKRYPQIEVPTGTKILALPTKLQEGNYGVYNGDIGTYIKPNEDGVNIYMYPLYDENRFDNVDSKMIIYGVDNLKYEFAEHTYLLDGDVLKLISSGSTVNYNDSDTKMLDDGYGFVSTNQNTIAQRNLNVDDDKVVIDKDMVNRGSVIKNRGDNITRAKYIGSTDNLFMPRSVVIKKTMMIYQISWKHCNPDLIYPGMPVMYIYMDGETLIKQKGVLQSAYYLYNNATKTSTGLLNIMVKKPEKESENV